MYISDHMQAVLDAPEEHIDGEAAAAKWTAIFGRQGSERKLRPIQGEALESFALALQEYAGAVREGAEEAAVGPRGGLHPIGVGHGKTLVTFLIPEVYRYVTGKTPRTMLIVPPDLKIKTKVDYASERRHFKIRHPNIVSMGVLSHMQYSGIFDRMRPDLIIVDEAHYLASQDAARTRRLMRWVQENPGTSCVFLSGTITSKSVAEYAHLSLLALRSYNPIPFERDELDLWRSMLDVKGEPAKPSYLEFLPLINWHRKREGRVLLGSPLGVTHDEARDAYRERLLSLPGVVGTSDASCGASLDLRLWEIELPDSWNTALAEFDPDSGSWELAGEELVDALAVARARYQLGSGYYTRWVWPLRVCPGVWVEAREQYTPCRGPGCPTCEGTRKYKGKDHEWLYHRKAWFQTERAILKEFGKKTGQDSPALVRKITSEGGFGASKARLLQKWEAVRPRYFTDGLGYQPPVEYVNLDPGPEWLVGKIREWMKKVPRGIVWYTSPHVGDALAASGLRVYGAGTSQPNDRVPHPCLKTDVHGTGKNLQAWSHNLVIEHTGNARTWEQMLGRTHRPGQEADEVRVDILADEHVRVPAYYSARIGSKYIQQTTGMAQRLQYATTLDPIKPGKPYNL